MKLKKKLALILILLVSAAFICSGCGKHVEEEIKPMEEEVPPAQIRLGIFPVWPAYDLNSNFATSTFLNSLTDALMQDLREANIGQIILIPWPQAISSEDGLNFETLVGRGIEAGCNGVLAVKIEVLDFSVTELEFPVGGMIKMANADIWLKGGLIDVKTAVGVSAVDARGNLGQKVYRGPSPSEVEDEPIGSQALEKSLLGEAIKKARRSFVSSVTARLERLTPGKIEILTRANAPEGVGFGEDSYVLEVTPGYDRRGTVTVVNRGKETQTFIIKPMDSSENIAVGLKGEGSLDSPCTLGPGQWKYVRLLVNANQESKSWTFKIGLFAAPQGEEPDPDIPPQDQATVDLKFVREPAQVKLSVLSQDPVTLAYTCALINQGDEISGLELVPAEGQEQLVRTVPEIIQTRIQAGGSLPFTVVPRFPPGLKTMDVTLEGYAGASKDSWTFHFEVPEGKSIFYGLGNTTTIYTTDLSVCTNHGLYNVEMRPHPKGPRYTCWAEEFEEPSLLQELENLFYGFLYSACGDPLQPMGNSVNVRGATIRENVSAFLPELEENSITHPMAAAGDRWNGFVNFAPTRDGTSVNFVAFARDGDDYIPPVRLNEKGHTARWPYIRAQYNGSRAFVVWEDSTGGGTDVAFRASGEEMSDWGPVLYLTNLGAGVSDPVVQRAADGTLIVAWEDLRSGRGHIYLRLSRDGGKSFAPEVAIPIAEGEMQSWPQVAPTADRKFALIYVSKADTGTKIAMRMLDESCNILTRATVLSNLGVSCGEPQIACDLTNHLYAVWREGEGQESEIWFTKSVDGAATWSPPAQLTRDDAYSEYPLVGVNQSGLWVSYHSSMSRVADLKYVTVSGDQGETWGEPVTMPSMGGAVERAWLEFNFSLQWPRSDYHPHNTYISFNGVQVGAIENKIPEGIYIFEVPSELVLCSPTQIGFNKIEVRVEGLNQADYIMMTKARLLVRQKFSQVQVMARDQAEADELAKNAGADINHSQPDLAVAANAMQHLPARLKMGQDVDLTLEVHNLGEAPAKGANIAIYRADPRDPAVERRKAKLDEHSLSDLPRGARRATTLSFRFDQKATPRAYIAVQCKGEDFYHGDNVWGLSFTTGESSLPTPLLGTDIPNLFYAPDLMDFVHIPNFAAMENLLSLPDFSDVVSLRDWEPPDRGKIVRSVINGLERIGIEKPDWIDF